MFECSSKYYFFKYVSTGSSVLLQAVMKGLAGISEGLLRHLAPVLVCGSLLRFHAAGTSLLQYTRPQVLVKGIQVAAGWWPEVFRPKSPGPQSDLEEHLDGTGHGAWGFIALRFLTTYSPLSTGPTILAKISQPLTLSKVASVHVGSSLNLSNAWSWASFRLVWPGSTLIFFLMASMKAGILTVGAQPVLVPLKKPPDSSWSFVVE